MHDLLKYDARSLIIKGQRKFLISGEVHYARIPVGEWETVLKRCKDSGLNTIATYVFWNMHEPSKDCYDFSGERNLARFLDLCSELQFNVILRCGPYCCAEWNFGGFPFYLRDEPGITIRTFNQPYLARVEKYFRHLFAEVIPYLSTRGGPILCVQLENEYLNVCARYGDDGQRYLRWIYEKGTELGIDVPIIMCEGAAPGAIETVNGYSISDDRVNRFRSQHPDLPIIWTELWPGWYDTWGFAKHVRDPRNIAFFLLDFLRLGGAGWNYYMWHGGTNFGRTAMFQATTAYEFCGGLDEFGRLNIKGAYLTQLHQAILSIEDYLLHGTPNLSSNQCSWAWNGNSISIQLGKKGVEARIIGTKNEILFDTVDNLDKLASFTVPPWEAFIKEFSWSFIEEPLPSKRSDLAYNLDSPMEQLVLTKDKTDYCWYSTILDISQAGNQLLEFEFAADYLRVYVESEAISSTKTPLMENRGPTSVKRSVFQVPATTLDSTLSNWSQSFQFDAMPGKRRVDILCTSMGLVKGDWMLTGPQNTECKGIWGTVRFNTQKVTNWKILPGLAGENQEFIKASKCLAGNTLKFNGPIWLVARFGLASTILDTDSDFRIDASGLTKGYFTLNGRPLGRYWLIPGFDYGPDESWQQVVEHGCTTIDQGQPTQRFYRVPKEWLQNSNELTIFEEVKADLGLLSLEHRKWPSKF